MLKKILLLLLPLAILAGGWLFLHNKTSDRAPTVAQDETNNSPSKSPFQSADSSTKSNIDNNPQQTEETADSDTKIATAIVDDISQSDRSTVAPDNQPRVVEENVDVTTLAVEKPLTDEEFARLKAQMRNDRNLRLQILDEFSYNIDPERAKQLAALLSSYDDPEIMQTASALVYSGDPVSKTAGLDLLSRIQPRNSDARDIAIDLLSSENDPEFLVSTMNVLSTSSSAANGNQRQLLASNLNNLSNHFDPTVRSGSLALMGRWDKNSPASRESLTRGLTDSDASVRSTAAYSIRNIQNPDDSMITGLLGIAEDTDNTKSTRYAALGALSDMPLSGSNARRYSIAKQNISRRVQ